MPWWGWLLLVLLAAAGWWAWNAGQAPVPAPPTAPVVPVTTGVSASPHSAVTAPGGRLWDLYQAQKEEASPLAWRPFLESVRSLNPELG